MSKKNIDKLFQEKLNDFHEIPDEKVWHSISESLDKKKSRNVIPVWWKLGGVAALIALLFVLFNPMEDKSQQIVPVISDTENLDNKKQNNPEVIDPVTEELPEATQLADTESGDAENFDLKKGQESIVTTRNEQAKTSDAETVNNSNIKKTQLANVASEKSNEKKSPNEEVLPSVDAGVLSDSEIQLAENTIEKSIEEQKNELKYEALENKLDLKKTTEMAIAEAASEKETSAKDEKKSIFDEIEKQNADDEAVAENSKDKWSVGANVAPVYFGAFGEGSPIDPAFNTNSKSGELNMSYGLSVAYNVTDKLRIRTGVNKVDFGYDTNEVEFSASLQGSLSSRLNNVNYSESAENVIVGSKRVNSFALADRSTDVIANDLSRNGVMAQEFGYIEVPLELDYALIENRFGLNFIGGVSTLFLTENSVVLNDADQSIELGEANNINNVNFSTNIGFGLNYKFSQKIRLNFEPVFKYQLGTFSDVSGSFSPFSVGVYSGLNYKF